MEIHAKQASTNVRVIEHQVKQLYIVHSQAEEGWAPVYLLPVYSNWLALIAKARCRGAGARSCLVVNSTEHHQSHHILCHMRKISNRPCRPRMLFCSKRPVGREFEDSATMLDWRGRTQHAPGSTSPLSSL